ncbi:MAG: electron transport complex subunit RsxG [Rhodocyclaceae bacterium]|nr:electron transport complex subunit RsxG [Rhodocyclaceae bacterium]
MMTLNLEIWRDKLIYQGLSLGLVAMLCGSALVMGNQLTREAIRQAEAEDLAASLAQVLPAGFAENDLLADSVHISANHSPPVTVYRARKAGLVTAAVFQTSARGYAGEILVLIGVDREGRLTGARVLKHTETPGLGDKIEIGKSKWILSFTGKSLVNPPAARWAVKKDGGDFDQFAGATITPRAVVAAVKNGLEFFATHREEILR